MKKIIIMLVCVITVCLAVLFFINSRSSGVVGFAISPSGAVLVINGEQKNSDTKLSAGTHKIEISSPGYISYSDSIIVKKNDRKTLKITLLVKNTENVVLQTISDNDGLAYKKTIEDNNMSVLSTKEFYKATWIAAIVQTNSDPGLVILSQSPENQTYTVVLGPGTSFTDSSIAKLPLEVREYVRSWMNGE